MTGPILEASLPPLQKLALAYAPTRAREPWLALMALDARLADILRQASEPMMAQLRLAWWRETLQGPAGRWPEGEPLLGALRSWGGGHTALGVLVDGWEAMTAPAPLGGGPLLQLAEGRGRALAALSSVIAPGREAAAERAGRRWALADLAGHLGNDAERGAVLSLLHAAEVRPGERLARPMRPLAILENLATRRAHRPADAAPHRPADLLAAIRIGLTGR